MKRLLPLLIILAAACSSSQPGSPMPAAIKVGSYVADAGPSPVGVIPTAKLHDAQRNKDVEISIDYPALAGTYPVIVFSHAYGLSDTSYEPLVSYWASNGYVVIRPAHADANALSGQMRDPIREAYQQRPPDQRNERRERRPRPTTQTEPATATPAPFRANPFETIWDTQHEAQFRDRVADIELVIDSLNAIETQFPELAGKMDHSKIGVAGHSYGAFDAMLAGGARTFGNPPLQLGDPRVKAIIAMSPFGTAENRGLTQQSFATIRVPAMFMTGSGDVGSIESETPAWRKQAFDYSPAGDKYWVLIQGARSTSFTGGSTASFDTGIRPTPAYPPSQYPGNPSVVQPMPSGPTGPGAGFISDRTVFQKIKIASQIFWDAYLKNQTSARELLTQDKMPAGVTIATK